MKSYTNIEQSKKLAKILLIESADMEYLRLKETNATISSVPFVKDDSEVENSAYDAVYERVPCWSLAALLSVLPNYQLQTQDDGIGILCSCNGNFNIVTADNPVDACYEIVIRLSELNLL